MMWFKEGVMFVLFLVLHADATESETRKMKREISALYEQLDVLKSSHINEIKKLREEFEELKRRQMPNAESTNERNEKLTLEWARNSMRELRNELREMSKTINSSALLHQLHTMHNQIKRVLSETSDFMNLGRTQEARIDKLDSIVERLKYEKQETRNLLEQYRVNLTKLAKEVHAKQYPEVDMSAHSEVETRLARSSAGPLKPERNHKYRHNKMVHAQIARLAKAQEQLDATQQTMQTQMLDHSRRLDRLEEPNMNLVTAKIDLLELQAKVFSDRLNNNTMAVNDFEKVYASTLELREEVECMENKIDKTIPEFRKEISKLDVCVAQMSAHFSYVKEDQENLRQSVKAIAVSVSNALDRAEDDRDELKKVTNSVIDLQTRTKQHYHRLNDHIQKSEANTRDANLTEIISLPELMGEVKELQPVEREYEDLVGQLPRDCSTVSGPAGSYLIHPGRSPVDVWCDNRTTLVQRRYNGTVEFNRKFADYASGFGNPASEYWLGLDTMHQLTADNCTAMRIDMTDIYGVSWYAQYENFYVGSADTGYVLEISGFKGNASDAFEYQNHMEFSAIDHDRDISNTHCAANYEGGWWFSHCQHVNINGKYTLGLTWFDGNRNEWIAVATSEMKMYRRRGCA